MDFPERLFAVEARERFAFLEVAGFTLVDELMAPPSDRRPRAHSLLWVAPGVRVETSLVLGFGGEEQVVTRMETTHGHWEFGPAAAHKGQEIRKALATQANEVAVKLPES